MSKIKNQVKEYHLGGIIFSLGGPVEQTHWLNKFQQSSKTPLLIGMDAEWGVAMRLDSVQAFPWNMTLGAIQDNKLVEAVGHRIGEQAKRLGVHINFAPDVDINTNPKNPNHWESLFWGRERECYPKRISFYERNASSGGTFLLPNIFLDMAILLKILI